MLTLIEGGRPLTNSQTPSHHTPEKEPPVLRLLGADCSAPGGLFAGVDSGVLEWAPRKLGGGEAIRANGLDWYVAFAWFAALMACCYVWRWAIGLLARAVAR